MRKDIWKLLRDLDEDRSTFKEETSMLLLRHRTDHGNEYKLLEYNAVEEEFFNPFTDEYESVNIHERNVDYINLDEI